MSTTFHDLLSTYMEDPEFREAYADAEALSHLREALVGIRKAQEISQAEVARRMGVGQSTVSGFETSANDPRISTLQRYARAVLARLDLQVSMPVGAAWATTASAERWLSSRNSKAAIESGQLDLDVSSSVSVGSAVKVEAWRQARDARREDFALGA